MATIKTHRGVSVACLVLAGVFATAGAAELPTARPAEVGSSAERLARLHAALQAEIDAGRKAGIVERHVRLGRRGVDRAILDPEGVSC